jgi:hypothetical protein
MLPLFLERVDFGKLNYYDEPNTFICEVVCAFSFVASTRGFLVYDKVWMGP